MSTQQTQWQLVADLMRTARDELQPVARSGALPAVGLGDEAAGQFEMFLENNELELAWDTLAEISDHAGAPRTVWEKLLLAAGLMSLREQAHLAATRLCSAGLTEGA
ncbi:MAG TPA: hypothetical protein VFI31_14915 [Pirellulales bacterium]|nr:hypothetical protein [Pirellulales bacterium]